MTKQLLHNASKNNNATDAAFEITVRQQHVVVTCILRFEHFATSTLWTNLFCGIKSLSPNTWPQLSIEHIHCQHENVSLAFVFSKYGKYVPKIRQSSTVAVRLAEKFSWVIHQDKSR
ncbi:hypothetical protein T11_2594 [Trichinella zimbabwensis]|uniref:Uncharacterized protein n=1 Tax=Trichinella zimbabwensis TaxID=268475 RepID=A0A0V1H8P2_9BILA|nr:hypothetical protein T11_2594 [Trichinella zimbabwensis]